MGFCTYTITLPGQCSRTHTKNLLVVIVPEDSNFALSFQVAKELMFLRVVPLRNVS